MTLEVLKGLKSIGGFNVVDMDALRESHPDMFRPDGSMHYHLFEKDIRPTNFIYIRQDVGSIAFTMQKGLIKDEGVKGCRVDTLLETARRIIWEKNIINPCQNHLYILGHLDHAIAGLRDLRFLV